MRCPICSAIVTGGDVCQNCGATLPANVRGAPPAQRKGGLLSGAIKPKRSSTLGDMFKSAASVRAPNPKPRPQQPQRPRGDASPPNASPPKRGRPHANDAPRGRAAAPKSPIQTRTPPPPAPVTPSSPSLDPWESSYGPTPFAAPPRQFAAPPAPSVSPVPPVSPPPYSSPPGLDDEMAAWQEDPSWAVVAPPAESSYEPHRPYGPYDEPSGEWPQGPARVAQSGPRAGDPYRMAAPPPLRGPVGARGTVARGAVSAVSRLTLNATMFGLVLLILAIAVVIGLRRVQSTQGQAAQTDQPTPTVVPTAVPPSGFAGLQANLYSVSYPEQWSHKPASDTFGCLCSLSGDMFGDGANTGLAIYTRPAIPADQLTSVLAQAAASVATQQTPRAILLNQQKTYDGKRWQENDYTITKVVGSSTVQLQVRVLVVNLNATTFIIVASAPQSGFSHANSTYFEPMLRSFRFD